MSAHYIFFVRASYRVQNGRTNDTCQITSHPRDKIRYNGVTADVDFRFSSAANGPNEFFPLSNCRRGVRDTLFAVRRTMGRRRRRRSICRRHVDAVSRARDASRCGYTRDTSTRTYTYYTAAIIIETNSGGSRASETNNESGANGIEYGNSSSIVTRTRRRRRWFVPTALFLSLFLPPPVSLVSVLTGASTRHSCRWSECCLTKSEGVWPDVIDIHFVTRMYIDINEAPSIRHENNNMSGTLVAVYESARASTTCVCVCECVSGSSII